MSIDEASPMEWDKVARKTTTKYDVINKPEHYAKGKVECIEAIKESLTPEAYKGYLKGNVMKYVWRYESKCDPVEDLRKARVYLEWLIKAEVGS